MKIGVVGCGALGSFYGARLCRLGQETHFLLRSDYDAVNRNGVSIRSPGGDFHVRPHCAKTPEEIGVCDLVVIGLKTTANGEYGRLLTPLIGPKTAVLTLQNGLGNEELLAKLFGGEKILGGLCFVCLNRIEPGLVHHIAHGNILMGEYQRMAQARTHEICAMFCQSGVACKVTDNLDHAHWEKLIWNVAFNGLGVAGAAGYDAVMSGTLPENFKLAACMATDKLLGDDRWLQLVREMMLEIIHSAGKLGHHIPESTADDHIERTRRMGAYRASTLVDFERGGLLEIEALFLEPRRRAREAGAATPRLDALCAVLTALDSRMPRGDNDRATAQR